jgi:hypothetical protein
MRKLVLSCCCIVVLYACNQKQKVIAIPQMKLVMWDVITADEWMKRQFPTDTIVDSTKKNIALYNKIFSLYKLTKEDYYSSYDYYKNHPNEMKILLDSLAAFGTRKRDTLTNHIGK